MGGDREVSSFPTAGKVQHEQFCKTEDWERVLSATGKPTQDHVRYQLALPDGRILKTKISRPIRNDGGYGRDLFSRILGPDQLDVTEQGFWDCVREGVLPERGVSVMFGKPEEALSASLVHQLTANAGLSMDEVSTLSKEEAVERLNAFYSRTAE